ncbi:MAG: relaxase/mobilization nuclease domain-containing protein [Ruminococcus sp.]|nr:relaxase/mobilization nuclease domain-containing protein [Ruminococcus sp.]MCM1382319.1 relaxase/mobilization nuclease domain-containing protein [Muribaculaceae bacterium]MCM1480487.1 relaxase/mobilization nuclease domain-containing protein [Muribaculaceae bacterium]
MVTLVNRTANGIAALMYVLNGAGHNGAEFRNRMVTPIYMSEDVLYFEQMNRYWRRARSNHKTQLITIIQSFSLKELDPNNPNDILKANMIGQELVRRHFPGRQALVCTQTDGKGGKVHNHILINDVSMVDRKGCDKNQYHYTSVERWTNEIASEYTIIDTGKKCPEKVTKEEKRYTERGEYCFITDIKNRVEKAMESSESEDDFIEKLKSNGVSVKRGKSKTYGDYFTYELDVSTVPEGTKPPKCGFKRRSYRMGEDYSPAALEKEIERVRKTSHTSVGTFSTFSTKNSPAFTSSHKENVSVSEEKVSVLQAVSETEFELEPKMKMSSVREKPDEECRAEAAVPAVPKPAEDVSVPAAIQRIVVDDSDDEETDFVKTKRGRRNGERRKRDVPVNAQEQVVTDSSRFDSAFEQLPDIDEAGTHSGKSDDEEYGN